MEMMGKIRRMTHHCHIVETGSEKLLAEHPNESYRLQHSSMAAKSRIKSREQARRGSKTAPHGELF